MSAAALPSNDGDGPVPTYLGCESCGLVSTNRLAPNETGWIQRCPRCEQPLRLREPKSLQHTWAWLIAAAILYVPANALPIFNTTTTFQRTEHTLLGGIHELWTDGSWFLAAIVFVASIAVPVLKIGVLALLSWSVQRRPHWRRIERAKLYRLIQTVGHWSMLDVYVVVILAATVRFGPLASASAGPGLLCFAAVVVFTLFATHSFDPKMIWQNPDSRDGHRNA